MTGATTLGNIFKNWGTIQWVEVKDKGSQRDITLAKLGEAFSVMPPDVRAVNQQAILEWPEHERERLAKLLDDREKSERKNARKGGRDE